MKKPCEYCSEEFEYRRKTARFCGSACRSQYHLGQKGKPTQSELNNEPLKKQDGKFSSSLRGVVSESKNSANPLYEFHENQVESTLSILKQVGGKLNRLLARQKSLKEQESGMLFSIAGGAAGYSLSSKISKSEKLNFGNILGIGLGILGGLGVKSVRERSRESRLIQVNNAIVSAKKQFDKFKTKYLSTKRILETIPKYLKSKEVIEAPELDNVHFENEIPPSNKIVRSSDLQKLDYHSLSFTGKWKELIGCPSVSFHTVVHGVPGQGKSTFCIQFAKYLAKNFGRVLYISSEEGFNKTMNDKLSQNQAYLDNLLIADLRTYQDILDNVEPNQFHFIFIDSLNDMGIDVNDLKELRDQYSESALITISQSTKNGKIRGSQQIVHDCDVEVRIEEGKARCYKNRFRGLGYEFRLF